MGHLDELILDVAGLGSAIVVSGNSSSTDQNIAYADLAAAVALAVVTGKALHQHPGKFMLAAQEDTVIGNKYIVKDGQGFHAAELGVTDIEGGAFQLTGVAALAADDHEQTGGIQRNGEGNRIVLIIGTHGLGGHNDDLVGVADTGLVGLGAADYDTVGAALHNTQEHIRIYLCMGRQGTVALGVGHGAVNGQVVLGGILHELHKVLMVVGAVSLVTLIGGGEQGVKGVHAYAALEAGCGLLAAQALHLYLLDEVLGALVDVGEAVDAGAGVGGNHGHQVLILGHLGQVVGHTDGVERRTQNGALGGVIVSLTEHIDLHFDLLNAFDILFACHQCHFRYFLSFFGFIVSRLCLCAISTARYRS